MSGEVPQANERRPSGAAFAIAAFLAGVGILLIWEAASIPARGGYSGIGSADIPRLIGWALVVLAGLTVIAGFRGEFSDHPRQQSGPVLWIVGGLGLQLVLLHPIGFSTASGLLFACTAAAFGRRNLLLTVPIGVVFALIIYAVFDRLLKLNLPEGPLERLVMGSG